MSTEFHFDRQRYAGGLTGKRVLNINIVAGAPVQILTDLSCPSWNDPARRGR